MKALVVDDHALIRQALQIVLNRLQPHIAVLEAATGCEAMQVVEKHLDLSLILLDINLPDRDGFSVLRELRDRYPTVAVIVLSALNDQDTIKRAFNQGVLGFIPKTSDPEVTLNAIQTVLTGNLYIPPESHSPYASRHLVRPSDS